MGFLNRQIIRQYSGGFYICSGVEAESERRRGRLFGGDGRTNFASRAAARASLGRWSLLLEWIDDRIPDWLRATGAFMNRNIFRVLTHAVNGLVVLALISLTTGWYARAANWRDTHVIVAVDGAQALRHDPALQLTHHDFRQIYCLAQNMYHEARTQGDAGMEAVSKVVFNRAHSGLFPAGICQVIYQARLVRDPADPLKLVPAHNQCQFSWVCDGRPHPIRNNDEWKHIYQLAYNLFLYDKLIADRTDGATYYHANYVAPKWSHTFHRTTQIGVHIFYRPRVRKTS